MEDGGQTFAADGEEHLLHQHQPLPRGEIGHPSAGGGEALGRAGGGMLRLRLQKDDGLAPEVLESVSGSGGVLDAHVGRGRDGIGAGPLGPVLLHPDGGSGSVLDRVDARVRRDLR